jgi:hypothetical protein
VSLFFYPKRDLSDSAIPHIIYELSAVLIKLLGKHTPSTLPALIYPIAISDKNLNNKAQIFSHAQNEEQ